MPNDDRVRPGRPVLEIAGMAVGLVLGIVTAGGAWFVSAQLALVRSSGLLALWLIAANTVAITAMALLTRRGRDSLAVGLLLPWALFLIWSLVIGACTLGS